MTKIADGKLIAGKILEEVSAKVEKLKSRGIKPKLKVFLVGSNPSSVSYIRLKVKKAREVGIEVETVSLPESTVQAELESEIEKAGKDHRAHAILIQLPLPENYDKEHVLSLVPPKKDVDSLSSENKGALIQGKNIIFFPPAARAALAILDHHQIDLTSKEVLIIGTGDLIGRPVAALLLSRGVNFKLANRYTEDLDQLLKDADVVITGAGKPGLVRGERIKRGAVVIDAGTTGSETGQIAGDVDLDSVRGVASLVSPVPGGIGPVTVAMLLQNVVEAAKKHLS